MTGKKRKEYPVVMYWFACWKYGCHPEMYTNPKICRVYCGVVVSTYKGRTTSLM